MPDTVLFAKKLILPSRQANTLQSLNMAAAFNLAGAKVYFYPGLKPDAPSPFDIAQEYGLQVRDPAGVRTLAAPHKGLYGLLFRLHVAARYARGVDCVIARDTGEAIFISLLKRFLPGKKGKKRTFLYEMHEALYVMHQNNPGRHDWRVTMEREKRILRQTDGLILLSATLEEQARKALGFTGPILVESNGFNPELFYPLPLFDTAVPWPGPDDVFRLIYVGAMLRGKGVPELIDAMGKLPERFHLRIIGNPGGGIPKDCEELLAAIPNSGNRIQFMGQIPQSELRDACMGAHMAIIPQQESAGFFSPIKLYEYLALGLPVVCTPLPIFREKADCLQLARDSSSQALAAAISELAEAPSRAEDLRIRGLEAAKQHTWLARAERILAFANSIQDGPKKSDGTAATKFCLHPR